MPTRCRFVREVNIREPTCARMTNPEKMSGKNTGGYKVGALSALISEKKEDNSLPFASLFTTAKRQPSPEIPSPKKNSEKTSEKQSPTTKKKSKKNVPDTEDGISAKDLSLRSKVKKEDSKSQDLDPEKEKRTIFIGNLSVKTTKKEIFRLAKPYGTVETVRFRGVARPDPKTLKKVAVIKKKSHESRSCFSAYVRFSNEEEAQKSLELNSKEFNGKTLRVDVALRSDTDQKKAVFLGNLPFSLEEDDIRSHFENCGPISDVRVVRDKSTGMGKGFGYVNFESADAVETALQLDGLELGQRRIRVCRSSNRPKPLVKPTSKANVVNKKDKLKKVKKSYVKNSFRGVCATDSENSKSKRKKTKHEKRKDIIAKKLAS